MHTIFELRLYPVVGGFPHKPLRVSLEIDDEGKVFWLHMQDVDTRVTPQDIVPYMQGIVDALWDYGEIGPQDADTLMDFARIAEGYMTCGEELHPCKEEPVPEPPPVETTKRATKNPFRDHDVLFADLMNGD